jgi:exodeoxyribonuclease V alpha subunit
MNETIRYSPHAVFAEYFGNDTIAPYLYALSKSMANGHICIDLKDLPTDDEFWKDYDGEKPGDMAILNDENLIGDSLDTTKPFILVNEKLYLQRYFYYETLIIDKLMQMTNAARIDQRKELILESAEFVKNLRSNDKDLNQLTETERPDYQLVAALQGFLQNFSMITGGPGTGKTTTVAKILALLNKTDPNLKVAIAAPTARAAIRIKESLLSSVQKYPRLNIDALVQNLEPQTIHRLLGSKKNSPFFKANKKNPLPYDVIIIDEASMIGVALFAKLVDAVGPDTRLIILGDAEQLASVDVGSLFGDLCSAFNQNKFTSEQWQYINNLLSPERRLRNDQLATNNDFLPNHLVRLEKTYRYSQDSKIGRFTKAVIAGEKDKLEGIALMPDTAFIVDYKSDDKIFDNFIINYQDYIQEDNISEAIKRFENVRVLCAARKTAKGVNEINKKIASVLRKKCATRNIQFDPTGEFYENLPVLITKNTTDLDLFNGDIGIMRRSKWHKDNLMVFFPSGSSKEYGHITGHNIKAVNPGFIEHWEPVYAMTIHKSQGSEFEKLLVLLPDQIESRILSSELLYTAITRAKASKSGEAIVQSSLDVLQEATGRRIKRVSGIVERLKNHK